MTGKVTVQGYVGSSDVASGVCPRAGAWMSPSTHLDTCDTSGNKQTDPAVFKGTGIRRCLSSSCPRTCTKCPRAGIEDGVSYLGCQQEELGHRPVKPQPLLLTTLGLRPVPCHCSQHPDSMGVARRARRGWVQVALPRCQTTRPIASTGCVPAGSPTEKASPYPPGERRRCATQVSGLENP